MFVRSDYIFAQCNQSVKWVIERTEIITESGEVRRSASADFTITTNNNKILINDNTTGEVLTGYVNQQSCEWVKPFVRGKNTYKAIFKKADENQTDGEMVIEGDGEKLEVLLSFASTPGKMRMIISRFEAL